MKHIDKKGRLTDEFINFIKSHETVRRTDTGELRRTVKVDSNLREKLRKEFNIIPNKEINPTKKLADSFWDGEAGRIYLAMEEKNAADSRLSQIEGSANKEEKALELQRKLTLIEKENQQLKEDKKKYSSEKRKAGSSSYKNHKALREKVVEICLEEIARKKYSSAEQLSKQVAKIIEKNHHFLLKDFKPYKRHLDDGFDWLKPTFYNWCNKIYKMQQ